MSELYFVRHAQAAFGTDDYDRLSATGRHQAAVLGRYFSARSLRFDRIFSGTLRRHQQTLAGILRGCPQAAATQINPGLDEYHFTALHAAYARRYPQDEDIRLNKEQQDAALFYKIIKKSLLAWHDGELDDGVAEGWAAFRQRISTALDDICRPHDKGVRSLIITSGGVVSMMLFEILQLPWQQAVALNMQLRNSSITHCYYAGDQIQLASFNAIPHLDTAEHRALITLS